MLHHDPPGLDFALGTGGMSIPNGVHTANMFLNP